MDPMSWTHPKRAQLFTIITLILVSGASWSCQRNQKPTAPAPRWAKLPPRVVPAFMKGTIYERVDVMNLDPQLISGYGLVVNLPGTGAGPYPTAVREYMIREMAKRSVGSSLMPGWEDIAPERMLNDSRVSIVRVNGYVPPGARVDQTFDVQVSAIPLSQTTSLHRGDLYRTDLQLPGGSPGVNVQARSQGPIFVNPALAIESLSGEVAGGSTAKASLRVGWVMDGGVVTNDRPLVLRLLSPERRVARALEFRVDQYFQDTTVAAAEDEALVMLYMPRSFKGDWEHFMGIVTHLYLDTNAEFAVRKSRELAAEAMNPDAPLMDISYTWEGLGASALPAITPLMLHASPDVQFAAARAAAFLGDASAQTALIQIATAKSHPFQLNAVQTLGALPNSPAVNQLLRRLLDAEETLVRVEAYKVLAANRDPSIISKVIGERFVLDRVPSNGPPIVYATRRGTPRVAVFGRNVGLQMPIVWMTMNDTLMIATEQTDPRLVTIFYRGRGKPIKVLSRPDLAEIIARLGGEGPRFENKLDFTYTDIVGIMQQLSDQKRLSLNRSGQQMLASFVLEDLPSTETDVLDIPLPDEPGRQQADKPEKVGRAE